MFSYRYAALLLFLCLLLHEHGNAGISSSFKKLYTKIDKTMNASKFQSFEHYPDDSAIMQHNMVQKAQDLIAGLASKLELAESIPGLCFYKTYDIRYEYNAATYYSPTARKHIVLIGDSLMQRWDEGWFTDQEIEALLAHELCHIKNGDSVKGVIAAGVVNWLGFVGKRVGFNTAFNPCDMCKNAFVRSWEKAADTKAISLINDPFDLARALVKLECLMYKKVSTKEQLDERCTRTIADFKIEQKIWGLSVVELFFDHPLTSKRIAYIAKRTNVE